MVVPFTLSIIHPTAPPLISNNLLRTAGPISLIIQNDGDTQVCQSPSPGNPVGKPIISLFRQAPASSHYFAEILICSGNRILYLAASLLPCIATTLWRPAFYEEKTVGQNSVVPSLNCTRSSQHMP